MKRSFIQWWRGSWQRVSWIESRSQWHIVYISLVCLHYVVLLFRIRVSCGAVPCCAMKAIFLGVITGSSTIMATMDTFVVKEAEWQAWHGLTAWLIIHGPTWPLTTSEILDIFRNAEAFSCEFKPKLKALPILNLHTTLALLIAVFSLNLFSAFGICLSLLIIVIYHGAHSWIVSSHD